MDWTMLTAIIGSEGVKYLAGASAVYLAGWKSCEKILVHPERERADTLQTKLDQLDGRIREKFWEHVQ